MTHIKQNSGADLTDSGEQVYRTTVNHSCARNNLVVQDNAQEGIVDVDLAVVFDESQFLEFVHEQIDSGSRRTNDLRQHLLRYFGKRFLRLSGRTVAREQQQSAREALLGRVEKLIDEICFNSNVSRQHMSDEAVRELVFLVEHANHLVFLNDEHGGGCNRGSSRHVNGLTRKAPFTKEIARSHDRHDGFFAGRINHS